MPFRPTRAVIGLLGIVVLIGVSAWLARPQPVDPEELFRRMEAERDSALPGPDEYAEQARLHDSVDEAALDAGYALAFLDGREADLLGVAVAPPEANGVTGPGQPGAIQFYTDVNLFQWPHPSPEDAQEGAASLGGKQLTIDGHRAYLLMNSTTGGGLSQLSWAKGNVFYYIRADQRKPQDVLIDAANSVVYP